MRRPRNPTPLNLSGLHLNFKTSLYEITRENITYSMPLELTRHLKEYFRNYDEGIGGKINYPSVAKWYADLTKEQKKQVIRTGNLPSAKEDFFPDAEFD